MAIAVLLFLTAGIHAMAQGLTIRPTDTGQTLTSGTDYTYTDGLLTVKTTKPVTISSNGEKTDHTIAVADEIGGQATITLENVYIEKNTGSLFDIQGSASVLLKLTGVNLLMSPEITGNSDDPILRCEKNGEKTASLEIEGPGELRVKLIIVGNYTTIKGAGIGGGSNRNGGNITIKSGIVMVEMDSSESYIEFSGAGIGGGDQGTGGNITISGGVVTTGSARGAGIGGGKNGAGGKITINGGVVTANSSAAAIGGGYAADGGDITISGGAVTAISTSSSGIGGGGSSGTAGTFSTGTGPGNAFIIARCLYNEMIEAIGANGNKSLWSGIIFEGKERISGKVYGNPTLPEGVLTIPSDLTLTIDDSKTLTIGSGTTLINEGTIINNGTINNSGILAVRGTLTNDKTYSGSGTLYKLSGGTVGGSGSSTATNGVLISFDGNDNNSGKDVSNLPPVQVITTNSGNLTKPTATPLRFSYTYLGWSEDSGDRTLVSDDTWGSTTLSADKTYHAVWKYNTKLAFTGDSYSDTYGEQATVEATATGDGTNETTGTVTYSYYSDAECTQPVAGTPTDVGTYYVKATYPGDDYNMKVETSSAVTYKIEKKELTVTPTPDQTIYSDEHPAYTVSGAVEDEQPAFTGHLDVSGNKVTLGTLALTNDKTSGFTATNYTFKLSSGEVGITQDSKTLAQAYETEATAINDKVTTDWYTEKVDLTPSTGFKIKGSSVLKSTSGEWKDKLTVDGDGIHEVTYRLLRDGRTTESGDQTLTVNLDKTKPTVTPTSDKLTLTVTLSDVTSGLASCTYVWNNGGEMAETLTSGEKSHSFTLTAPAYGSYPLKVVVTDVAGNVTTHEETVTLTEPVNPPVDPVVPPVGPSEPEVTYTVTLPSVEGAITDPAAGNYEVTSWSDFGFLLTLDAAYNQSVPIVTTDLGQTIEPRASDGKYVIKQVRNDISVHISGIVKNPDPVANEKVSSPALRIYTAEGILCLDVPTATEAWLITADGRLLRSLTLSPGLNRVYGLRQGVYIVRLKDGTTRKVLIG